MTLTEFLLARIADDQQAWSTLESWSYRPRFHCDTMAATTALPTPAPDLRGRMLAECEAKRRIIELHDNPCPRCGAGLRCVPHDVSAGEPCVRYDHVDDLTLRALALPYADHPDYDETWRP